MARMKMGKMFHSCLTKVCQKDKARAEGEKDGVTKCLGKKYRLKLKEDIEPLNKKISYRNSMLLIF